AGCGGSGDAVAGAGGLAATRGGARARDASSVPAVGPAPHASDDARATDRAGARRRATADGADPGLRLDAGA
ncbi:hypothetical protein QOZ89_18355, partial [Pseudofrankia sp. BMG5.37]